MQIHGERTTASSLASLLRLESIKFQDRIIMFNFVKFYV